MNSPFTENFKSVRAFSESLQLLNIKIMATLDIVPGPPPWTQNVNWTYKRHSEDVTFILRPVFRGQVWKGKCSVKKATWIWPVWKSGGEYILLLQILKDKQKLSQVVLCELCIFRLVSILPLNIVANINSNWTNIINLSTFRICSL